MMFELNPAQQGELNACFEMIEMGKACQRAQGFVQWTDDYPCLETLREDIRNGEGYVLRENGRLAAYLCITFRGDPDYEKLQGEWNTKPPYAVVHRMAFHDSFCGKGLFAQALRLIEAHCIASGICSIRVDTDPANRRMQHILEKNGFVSCGMIEFQGAPRIAYDKILLPEA